MHKLSAAATEALINVGTNRQGAVAQGTEAAMAELQRAGLIGDGFGLTRRGTIVRERVMSAALEAAFA
jgi:hypothetical protein